MKITPEIIKEIECLLDMRKKNGDVIWEDGTELEFKISGTFILTSSLSSRERNHGLKVILTQISNLITSMVR